MTLVFSFVVLGILGGRASRRLRVGDALLVACCLPLVLIACSSLVTLLLSTLNLQVLSVGNLTHAVSLTAVVLCLGLAIRPSSCEQLKFDASIVRLLAVGLLSVGLWRFGIGVTGLPPSDNDALVHAFTLRRMGEMTGHPACLLPRDALSEFGLRFVPCGAHLLHYMDFVGLFRTTSSSLNSVYLLGALILPLGVAAFLRELSPQNTRLHLIGAIASLVFLVYPYALNGTLPYLVGLTFVFPAMALIVRGHAYGPKGLLTAGACLSGLALVHPTALLLALAGGASVVTTRRQLSKVVLALLVSVPLSLLLVPSTIGTSLLNGLRNGRMAGQRSDTSFWQRLILGSEWTRPQPILTVLALAGLLLLWRRGPRTLRATCVVLVSLTVVYLAINSGNQVVNVATIPFYGNWYRVLGALELLAVIPVAFAVDALLDRVNKQRFFSVAVLLILLSTLSMVTGYRIVSQAWSRQTSVSKVLLDSIERIPSTLSGRVLNDPADGSAWSYSTSNLQLLGAVDRAPDSYYGMIVDRLVDSDLRPVVCSVINNSRVEFLMLSSGRAALGTQLATEGVVSDPVFKSQYLMIFPFTTAFKDDCSHRGNTCIEPSEELGWFDDLVKQRFNRPSTDVFCAQ